MSSYPVWDDFWKGKLENLVIGKEIPDGEKEASQVSIPTESEFFCRTCSVQLLTREEQVTHYKSPEHRSLLKSKLRAKTGDAENESGSESDTSEEGSDWSGDDETATSANLDGPELRFRGRAQQEMYFFNESKERITTYRGLVAHRSECLSELEILKRLVMTRRAFTEKIAPEGKRHDAILLFSAGAFAGCIFENGKPLLHKCIKKYVIRAKRGSAQSTRDNQGNKPKSMGAQLRRENEKELCRKIEEQITEWGATLSKCATIFCRAPKHQKSVILQPLHRVVENKTIIRPLMVPMHKPRFEESQRVFQKIFSLRIHSEAQVEEFRQRRSTRKNTETLEAKAKPKIIANPHLDKTSDDEVEKAEKSVEALKITPKKFKISKTQKARLDSSESSEALDKEIRARLDLLFTGVRSGDVQKLAFFFAEINSPQEIINLQMKNDMTLLHFAAQQNSSPIIEYLLLNGSDPTLKNADKLPACRLCTVREARASFWNFRGSNPDKWDWDKAEVPDPACVSANPSKRKRQKPKKKKKSPVVEEKTVSLDKKGGLVFVPCSECGGEINGTPFKYSDFQFCNTSCLRAHRFARL
ncbi:unnamed protein product [Oikopleura dioica]|uniref:VLRF1 domain-containing protein n=1 Tax=Oikopleura dioica TaxID=34765 RepID=E4YUF1_OIKDI|nr:unnamed protein product [Oikopleura dioica]